MLQHIYKTSKRLVLAGYSLVEVSFVLMMVGVVVLPFLLEANEKNTLYEDQVTSLENASLNSTELIELLTKNLSRKSTLVEEITNQMVELASKGAKIVDKNMSARDELFSEPYLDNTATFFEDTDPSANVNYRYILPSAPERVIKTSQKTFFLSTSDSKYVPLFTYQWEFRDQSSNTDDDKQNTSTGTYLVRGELKVFEIATPTAQDNTDTVSQTTAPTETFSGTFNVRNNPLVEETKGKTPRVLLNFTFDMSRGACYSPATSPYSRRIMHDYPTLDLMTYDSGKGLLCAPYFQPSENNTGYWTDTPWEDGAVLSGGTLRPDWYDIYYNGANRLFWTNGLPSLKETSQSLPGTAMGVATSREASGFEAAEQGLYSSMPSSGDYTIRYPKLNNNLQRNFPDGDFDAVALNYIRCKNYNTSGKDVGAGLPTSVNLWGYKLFAGPNGTNPSRQYPQKDCHLFNTLWNTPANITDRWYNVSTGAPALTSLIHGRQEAFSRFWVRQDAGNFGREPNENTDYPLTTGSATQTFVTVEAARMAISSNLGPIGGGSGTYCIANCTSVIGRTLRPMKTVWSGDDNADEEQRWISGVEFQRSAASITLFKLLQHPTLSQAYDVSLLLNDPSEGTDEYNPTTYTPYPTDPIVKGTLSDPTQSNFKDVMKHLYGMNRLLDYGSNPGNEDYRHLANKGTFDVKEAITKFRDMAADTGTRYDHFVNVIYFPSDMSGDASVTLKSTSKIPTVSNVGKLSNEDDLKKHLGIDPPTLPGDPQMIPADIMDVVAPTNDDLKGKITYVLVVHKDTYDLFKTRVKWLAKEMGKKDVKVIYKEVKGIYDQPPARDDYETFVNDTLLEKLKNIQGTVTPGSVFNKMGKEQYSY
jgi:hypothetical protein